MQDTDTFHGHLSLLQRHAAQNCCKCHRRQLALLVDWRKAFVEKRKHLFLEIADDTVIQDEILSCDLLTGFC